MSGGLIAGVFVASGSNSMLLRTHVGPDLRRRNCGGQVSHAHDGGLEPLFVQLGFDFPGNIGQLRIMVLHHLGEVDACGAGRCKQEKMAGLIEHLKYRFQKLRTDRKVCLVPENV